MPAIYRVVCGLALPITILQDRAGMTAAVLIIAALIIASASVTCFIIGWFRVGARGRDLTDEEIIALGEFRGVDR